MDQGVLTAKIASATDQRHTDLSWHLYQPERTPSKLKGCETLVQNRGAMITFSAYLEGARLTGRHQGPEKAVNIGGSTGTALAS